MRDFPGVISNYISFIYYLFHFLGQLLIRKYRAYIRIWKQQKTAEDEALCNQSNIHLQHVILGLGLGLRSYMIRVFLTRS